jgi:hypothetical protein
VDLQNLSYALVQLVHNFGAAAVVGVPLAALTLARGQLATQHKLTWLVLAGWLAQFASGAGFGAVSYYNYGKFPDIHGIATGALAIKVACAATALLVAFALLRMGTKWTEKSRHRAWHSLTSLGTIALTAAAFLRWFS